MPPETREKKRLTSPPRGNRPGDTYPAFSPDGRTIAFSRVFHSSDVAQLYIQPLTATLEPAGAPRQLTSEDWLNTAPAWTPDGRAIVDTLFAEMGTQVTLTSTNGTAAAAADLAALKVETEKIGDDVRAIHAALVTRGILLV